MHVLFVLRYRWLIGAGAFAGLRMGWGGCGRGSDSVLSSARPRFDLRSNRDDGESAMSQTKSERAGELDVLKMWAREAGKAS